MKERQPEVEIYDDMGLAARVAAESQPPAEKVTVRTILADARRLSLDGLAVIREHPVWTAGIGGTAVTTGLAAGGVTAHLLSSRRS
jgi:hypothetical protein